MANKLEEALEALAKYYETNGEKDKAKKVRGGLKDSQLPEFQAVIAAFVEDGLSSEEITALVLAANLQ